MSGKIISYFPDVSMSNGHAGLARIAKAEGKKDVTRLHQGEFLLFINKGQTALKMLTCDGVLVHCKMEKNRRINPKTIPLLPNYFDGEKLNYKRALTTVIKRDFAHLIEKE